MVNRHRHVTYVSLLKKSAHHYFARLHNMIDTISDKASLFLLYEVPVEQSRNVAFYRHVKRDKYKLISYEIF